MSLPVARVAEVIRSCVPFSRSCNGGHPISAEVAPPAARFAEAAWDRSDFPERKMEIKGHLGNVISGNFCGNKALSEDFSEGNKIFLDIVVFKM